MKAIPSQEGPRRQRPPAFDEDAGRDTGGQIARLLVSTSPLDLPTIDADVRDGGLPVGGFWRTVIPAPAAPAPQEADDAGGRADTYRPAEKHLLPSTLHAVNEAWSLSGIRKSVETRCQLARPHEAEELAPFRKLSAKVRAALRTDRGKPRNPRLMRLCEAVDMVQTERECVETLFELEKAETATDETALKQLLFELRMQFRLHVMRRFPAYGVMDVMASVALQLDFTDIDSTAQMLDRAFRTGPASPEVQRRLIVQVNDLLNERLGAAGVSLEHERPHVEGSLPRMTTWLSLAMDAVEQGGPLFDNVEQMWRGALVPGNYRPPSGRDYRAEYNIDAYDDGGMPREVTFEQRLPNCATADLALFFKAMNAHWVRLPQLAPMVWTSKLYFAMSDSADAAEYAAPIRSDEMAMQRELFIARVQRVAREADMHAFAVPTGLQVNMPARGKPRRPMFGDDFSREFVALAKEVPGAYDLQSAIVLFMHPTGWATSPSKTAYQKLVMCYLANRFATANPQFNAMVYTPMCNAFDKGQMK